MIGLRDRGWIGLAAALAAGLISGCSAASPAPTVTQAPAATAATLDSNRIALQTLVPASALTDMELAAGARGAATYTGYSCVIAPVGCACETPVIQEASFTFAPDNRLLYDFTVKGGSPSQWQLEHAGYNQWSYSAAISSQSGEVAVLLALLSFTEDGYEVTQVATYPSGELSKCSNVSFHRLDAATPTTAP